MLRAFGSATRAVTRFAGSLRAHASAIHAVLAGALAVRWLVWSGQAATALVLPLLLVGAAIARPGVASAVAAGAIGLHAVLEAIVPTLPVPYGTRLNLEAASAILPPVAFAAFALAVGRERAPARLLARLAVVLAVVGSAVRLGEVFILFDRPGDASTLTYVLRYDGAYSLWGLAAIAAGVASASDVIVRALDRAGRKRRPERVAAAAAFVAFLVVALDVGALASAAAEPKGDLLVGYHADHVEDVPAGADVVHLEVAFPRIAPAEDARRWERVDAELEAAEARGLAVYLLVSTYPPPWLVQKHPDSVMQDADGEWFTWMDVAPGKPRERIWDLSFADERVLAAKEAFVAEAVARYGDHPSVRYVAVTNEPTYPFDWNLLRWGSFDAHTVAAFRDALHAEWQGDLDAMNEELGTEFESWADVEPPRLPFGKFGDRWIELREDLLIEYVERLVATAKAHTTKPVTVKIMAHALTRFAEPQAGLGDRAYRAFANVSDVVSVDIYPATRADLERQLRYFTEIAHGKPIVVAEFNLALGSSLPGSGMRMVAALRAMEPHVEAVILFSASGHYLYGVGPGSPAVAGASLYAKNPGDPGYGGALRDLAATEAAALAALPSRTADAVRALLVVLR